MIVSGRDVAAIHDPRPAVIIGACSPAGEIGFATVIWMMPLSHTPAMVAFSLREKSHTMGIIRQTGCFSASIPPADAQGARLVELCGSKTGHTVDKGALVAHTLVRVFPVSENDRTCEEALSPAYAQPACKTSAFPHKQPAQPACEQPACAQDALVPIVEHAHSWEIGTVNSIQPAGDHLLVIGTITCASTLAPRDDRGRVAPLDTLLCVQHGSYAKAAPLT